MAHHWAIARFDFGLGDAEFYRLTPRQFSLLHQRHLLERAHRELVGAYTTAAVISYSDAPPEAGVKLTDFMPSHTITVAPAAPVDVSDEEHQFNLNALILATQMRATQMRAAAGARHG